MIRYKNRMAIESWGLFRDRIKYENKSTKNCRKIRHINVARALFKIYHNHLTIRYYNHLHRTCSIFWEEYKFGKKKIPDRWS